MLGNWFERTTGLRLTKDLFCTNQVVDVNVQDGAPYTFTKITSNVSTRNIAKGALNEITFVPRIRNEHVGFFDQIQSTVTSTNIVGQIFKASKDNISALVMSMESAQGSVIDDFESYADNAELQAVWSTTGGNPALLETDISFTGSKSMRLVTQTNNEEWTRSSTPVNFSGFTGEFQTYFSHVFSQLKVAVFIRDNVGNSKSFVIIQDGIGILTTHDVNEAAMIDDQPTVTDVTNIVDIGFRVVDNRNNSFVLIDNLTSIPAPGTLEIKLWDMGTTLPDDGVTSIDDGLQYDQLGAAKSTSFMLSLEGGKRVYHLEDFFAGIDKEFPDNKLIIIDNYYIIEFKYFDTDINVYGPDVSSGNNNYNNGYAFNAINETTALNGIGEFSDLMFAIMSTQPVYFISIGWRFNASPNGLASILVFFRDVTGFVTEVVIDHEDSPEQIFNFDLISRPMFLDDGCKLQFLYNDDFTDDVSRISGEVIFWHEPNIING